MAQQAACAAIQAAALLHEDWHGAAQHVPSSSDHAQGTRTNVGDR